jgi:hypothetical protein
LICWEFFFFTMDFPRRVASLFGTGDCAGPAPDHAGGGRAARSAGAIWHSPGIPSLLVTYGVANDYFFSGHTAIAVVGATELARAGGQSVNPLADCARGRHRGFRSRTVLVLRAHYTMDVFTGLIAGLYVAHLADRICSRTRDQGLNPRSEIRSLRFAVRHPRSSENRPPRTVIQSLSSRSQHPLAFASYSPFTGSLSNPADGGFSPFICCDYFGLAKNQNP